MKSNIIQVRYGIIYNNKQYFNQCDLNDIVSAHMELCVITASNHSFIHSIKHE